MSVIPMRPPAKSGLDAVAITAGLRGFQHVRRFDLTYDLQSSHYTLRLTIANDAQATKTLVCRDVQNLELNPTGERFDQLLRLRVEDVREDGLDRIHFTVDELESESLFLHCASIELTAS